MASIRKEMVIRAAPDHVWAAVRDVGAVHLRLARGFVTDVRLDGDMRWVTFANGLKACELIVDVDDGRCRLAYASVHGRARHHHATMQVLPAPADNTLLLWVTDVLPHALKGPLSAMIEEGARAIRATLESTRPPGEVPMGNASTSGHH